MFRLWFVLPLVYTASSNVLLTCLPRGALWYVLPTHAAHRVEQLLVAGLVIRQLIMAHCKRAGTAIQGQRLVAASTPAAQHKDRSSMLNTAHSM
jgi:hypothetical protein